MLDIYSTCVCPIVHPWSSWSSLQHLASVLEEKMGSIFWGAYHSSHHHVHHHHQRISIINIKSKIITGQLVRSWRFHTRRSSWYPHPCFFIIDEIFSNIWIFSQIRIYFKKYCNLLIPQQLQSLPQGICPVVALPKNQLVHHVANLKVDDDEDDEDEDEEHRMGMRSIGWS